LDVNLVPNNQLDPGSRLPPLLELPQLLQHRHTAIRKVVYVCLERDYAVVAQGVGNFGVVAETLVPVCVAHHLPLALALDKRSPERLGDFPALFRGVGRLRAAATWAEVEVVGHRRVEVAASDNIVLKV